MRPNTHINVPILSTMLLFLVAGIVVYHYQPQVQHTPTHSNATHEDILYEAHKTRVTALQDEVATLIEDVAPFNTITNYLLLAPDIIQKFQAAGKHIEQLQKATACEGAGPWKAEDYVLALKQQRKLSLCEWLGGWGALINTTMLYEELKVCWLETGDAVMTADGKGIRRAQASNDGYHSNKQRPIGDEQALFRMELGYCREILESREEFMRDTGDLGEGKFLRSVVAKWRLR